MNEVSGLRKLGAMSLKLIANIMCVRFNRDNKNAVTYISPGTGLCMRWHICGTRAVFSNYLFSELN